MGLFFERRAPAGGDPIADAIQVALERTPAANEDVVAQAKSRAASAKAAAAGPVVPKVASLVVGFSITVVLLIVAFVLAAWVDPMIIDQAAKAAATPGYTPPDLQATQLSDAVRNMAIAWSGGLVGAILGDGVGTATSN